MLGKLRKTISNHHPNPNKRRIRSKDLTPQDVEGKLLAKDRNVGHIPPATFAKLSPEALGALTPLQIEQITPLQAERLTERHLDALNENVFYISKCNSADQNAFRGSALLKHASKEALAGALWNQGIKEFYLKKYSGVCIGNLGVLVSVGDGEKFSGSTLIDAHQFFQDNHRPDVSLKKLKKTKIITSIIHHKMEQPSIAQPSVEHHRMDRSLWSIPENPRF